MAAVEYVYCIVPSTFDIGSGIGDGAFGIDMQPVRLVSYQDLAAIVSTLDRAMYRVSDIEQRIGDVEWLKPRAIAHDEVITWSSDRSPTVPMPMWSLFSDEAAIIHTLQTQGDVLRGHLEKVRDAREYTIRVFVQYDLLTPMLAQLSSALAELERSVAMASPGQAYLLQRKADAERKLELRNITRQVAQDSYATLAEYAKESVHDPIAQRESEGQAILNASFLVPNDAFDAFREVLTTLIAQHQPAGFRFDFTGPWPPYHFVRGNP